MSTIAWIDSVLTDLRYALRDLRKHPSFTAIAVLMLAAGIGVNVMVFSVVNAVLFKGYPGVRENNRLVYMTSFEGCCVSYPDFLDWREEARSFQGMEITHGIQARLGDENLERYDATELSAGMFRLVGQQPVLGRDFSRADEVAGSPPVAILQYDFWLRRFNGDPRIIGSKVTINRSPTTIIGVMPEGFLFPQKNEMWVPLVKTANAMKRDNRQTWMVTGRLKDGVTIGPHSPTKSALRCKLFYKRKCQDKYSSGELKAGENWLTFSPSIDSGVRRVRVSHP